MLEQNIESNIFDIMCSSSRKTSQQKNTKENFKELKKKYKTKDLNDDYYNNDKTQKQKITKCSFPIQLKFFNQG